ncbi:hypothetical protein GQ600_7705 [Phytophthora cactorum]|nr:hypothetical protein GQ600_7705 [Phytophthora cactorum]
MVWCDAVAILIETSNDSLRATLAGTSNGTLDESIYKVGLINESLAFSNIQEGSHVMKLLNRQLKDSAALQNTAHRAFYQRNDTVVSEILWAPWRQRDELLRTWRGAFGILSARGQGRWIRALH